MLKSTIALLVVLFVSATNSKLLTEKDREDYRRMIEVEHINKTIKFITDRYNATKRTYDNIFKVGELAGYFKLLKTIDELQTVADQVRHNMTALKEKAHTNDEKCKKYEIDFTAKRQETVNNARNCMWKTSAEAVGQFDHIVVKKRKALRDMRSIQNQITFCVNDLKSNPGDIDYCESQMKQSIIEVRSDFEKGVSLNMSAANDLRGKYDAGFKDCFDQYGEKNFSKVTEVIVNNFAECLKSVEQGTRKDSIV